MNTAVSTYPPLAVDASPDERVVIRRILDGDTNAFSMLMHQHAPRVFEVVGRRVPSQEVASVAHDTFVSAFHSLAHFRPRQPFEHWLLRIARRRCCDYWREQGRRREQTAPAEVENVGDWLDRASAPLAHEASSRDEERQRAGELVQRLLSGLSPEDRALVEGLYFEDLPLREMAATMGWSLVATKVRAHRARLRLRKLCARHAGDIGAMRGTTP